MIIHRLDIIAGFIHCIMFSECLQLLRIDWCENLLTFTVQFKSCWPNWETKTRHFVLILKKIMFYELLLILQKLMKTNKTDDFFFLLPMFHRIFSMHIGNTLWFNCQLNTSGFSFVKLFWKCMHILLGLG